MDLQGADHPMNHLFCFGLGYSAMHIARRLSDRGWRITGTTTSQTGLDELARAGFGAILFDGQNANAQIDTALSLATHVLMSIPPKADGDPAFLHYAKTIRASDAISWIGYFSTVGVYPDTKGAWVTEDHEAKPVSVRGQHRLSAEQAWQSLGATSNKHVDIFRLPGIYGPGRSAIEDVKSGKARRLVKPGQVFNRIHVDDIAGAIVAAIDTSPTPHAPGASLGASTEMATTRVYNVTDDEPAPPQDVVAYAATLLGSPVPPDIDFATAQLSPMARSFYSECKRVSNARLKKELRPQLAYPTYREGLAAIAGVLKNPTST